MVNICQIYVIYYELILYIIRLITTCIFLIKVYTNSIVFLFHGDSLIINTIDHCCNILNKINVLEFRD